MSKKQIIAIFIVLLIAVIIIPITIYREHNSNDLNKKRTQNTTMQQPAEEFTNPDSLNTIFTEESDFKLKECQKNKKMTTYVYDFDINSENQEQNVFKDFGKELEKNGYEHISEIADGSGYRNQYEMIYNDTHIMVYTESSPDKVILSIVNFNEEA